MLSVKNIYLVEDEKEISDIIIKYLEKDGYNVTPFYNGKDAIEALQKDPPDLAILDIMLPGADGIEILKTIRENSDLPIIFLTSVKEEVDRVLGLELGADDYIPKPFSPRELIARIKSLFRRIDIYKSNTKSNEVVENTIKARSFTLDLDGHKLITQTGSSKLTSTEFDLLRFLMGRRGKIFSRTELFSLVWGDELYGETRTIDTHMRNIRKKIQKIGGFEECIQSVRGVGYTFED